MRLFAPPAIGALAAAALLTSAALVAHEDPAARPVLSGAWSIDKTLSTAPGSVGMPDDGTDGPGPGGGGRRRGGGPGGGFPGGMGGGGGRGGAGRHAAARGGQGRPSCPAGRADRAAAEVHHRPGRRQGGLHRAGRRRPHLPGERQGGEAPAPERHHRDEVALGRERPRDGAQVVRRPDPDAALRSSRHTAPARGDDHRQPRTRGTRSAWRSTT